MRGVLFYWVVCLVRLRPNSLAEALDTFILGLLFVQ